MMRLSAFTEVVKTEEILELYVFHICKNPAYRTEIKSQQTDRNIKKCTGFRHKISVFYKKVEIFKKNRNFSDPLASIYI